MAPRRIRIELFGNSNRRDYHVTTHVSSQRLPGGLLGGDRHRPFNNTLTFGEEDAEYTEETKSLVMKFYDIEAVSAVGVDKSKVEIERYQAYDWSDFEQEVIATVKQTVGWSEDDDVQVQYLRNGVVYEQEPNPSDVTHNVQATDDWEDEDLPVDHLIDEEV